MKKETKDCPNCEGAKYCISKPNKEDYVFPEEENQYLIDLECGIWDCHTAVLKLLKENKGLEKEIEQLKAYESHWDEIEEDAKRIAEENTELSNSVTELTNSKTELENKVTELEKQIEKMKTHENCKYNKTSAMDFPIGKYPCSNCQNKDKWEPAK